MTRQSARPTVSQDGSARRSTGRLAPEGPPRPGHATATRTALALRDSTPEAENPADFLEGEPSWTPESFGSLFGDGEEAETTAGLGRSRILRRRGPRRNLAALQEEELADVSVRAMTDLTPFLPPTTIKRSAKKARKPATAVMRS